MCGHWIVVTVVRAKGKPHDIGYPFLITYCPEENLPRITITDGRLAQVDAFDGGRKLVERSLKYRALQLALLKKQTD